MKFIVDENISPAVVKFLRTLKHNVVYVSEKLKSFDDESILKIALKEKRILITKDKDFGHFIFKKKFPHSGIIFLRLNNDSSQNTIRVLQKVFKNENCKFKSSFIIADDTTMRIIPFK